jgi:hypothetical protein
MENQMDNQMDAQQFRLWVSTYGGDPARWPDPQRDEMQLFLDQHPEAGAIIGHESGLDNWLNRRETANSPALEARIIANMQDQFAAYGEPLNAAPLGFSHQSDALPQSYLVSAAMSLAACLVAGVLLAPDALNLILGGPDLFTSLEVFEDTLLLN